MSALRCADGQPTDAEAEHGAAGVAQEHLGVRAAKYAQVQRQERHYAGAKDQAVAKQGGIVRCPRQRR